MPAESAFNQEKERSLEEECDDDNGNGMLGDSAVNQVEKTSQNENDDNIAADSAANQVENASLKEGDEEEEDDDDDHGDDKVPSQLQNELLGKIIDFALTGTEISLPIVPFVILVINLRHLLVVISVGSQESVTAITKLHIMATIACGNCAKNLAHAADLYWLLKR